MNAQIKQQEWDDSLLDGLPDPLLRWFAADCAERACVGAEVDDERSIKAIIQARRHALGEIGDEELREARKAAWGAAWYEARGAAWGAAWYEARGAAWYAAWYEAWDAAWYAARSAAWGAERVWQVEHLHHLTLIWNTCGMRGLWLMWDGEQMDQYVAT